MAWLAVDESEAEYIYSSIPLRIDDYFLGIDNSIRLPSGSIEKLIGRKLSWEDEPVEI